MSDILELLLDLVTDQLFFINLRLHQLDRLQLLVPLLVSGLGLFVEGLLLALADLKQLCLLLELHLRVASVVTILLHSTLLVLEDLALLLDLLTQEHGLVVKTLLLTLLINLLLLGLLDLLAKLLNCLDVINDLLLTGASSFKQISLLNLHSLILFFLLLTDLAQVLELLRQLFQRLFLAQLDLLKHLQL